MLSSHVANGDTEVPWSGESRTPAGGPGTRLTTEMPSQQDRGWESGFFNPSVIPVDGQVLAAPKHPFQEPSLITRLPEQA